MSTLLKRILFVVILLGIAYGIYWIIDREGADELKEDIVTSTQKTVETISKGTNDSVAQNETILPSDSGEELGYPSEIFTEENIVVNDPEIKEPETTQETPTKTLPSTTPSTTTKTALPKTTTKASSNVLFQLFK